MLETFRLGFEPTGTSMVTLAGGGGGGGGGVG
eukprot:COSAG01_NODE_29541_length_635_cov_0.875000_1_plen_31_part_10